ncbi:hypothetical protein [Staphylococcus phage vB_SauM-V1SA19]|nr:hypothetical protein [Staphylococcus phage vB_SauM-V1SA19]
MFTTLIILQYLVFNVNRLYESFSKEMISYYYIEETRNYSLN